MRKLYNILAICLLMSSCNSKKRLYHSDDETIQYGSLATFTNKGEMRLYCDQDTLILTQQLLRSNERIENKELLRCLYDEIYIGNKDAIGAMLKILEFKKQSTVNNIFIRSGRFRGKELFNRLFAMIDNFGCNNEYIAEEINYNLSKITYHYREMVRDVDNKPINEFLGSKWNKYDAWENYTDENCHKHINKLAYQIISDASEKDLIRLKNFGEE